ncbi:histidine kinase [Sinorhizobium sp. NG07B]|nr:histidine kinase [Sinorhizobium sp. NG07B]
MEKKADTKRMSAKAKSPEPAAKSPARKPTKAAAKASPARSAMPESTAENSESAEAATKPKLLSGGNPQIAKGYGDAPVQAYIAAMPGWKSDLGRRLDALIERTVPDVRKAVKWNSPLYGMEEQSWFLGIHCFTKYIKVAFFRGTSLHPVPPGESKQKAVRYLNIHEDEELDEAQFAAWVKQASQLPGERM